MLGKEPAARQQGSAGEAGDQPGADVTKAEVDLEEVEALLIHQRFRRHRRHFARRPAVKTWEETVTPQAIAVIIAMMDTSGSMGSFEKYVARSFFFWMTRFLRSRYEAVEIVFIAHHTEAKEVTEEEFFTRGEGGGTICSSAYVKALELIDSRFSPDRYNIYPFHFPDGDNLTSDNEKCVSLRRVCWGQYELPHRQEGSKQSIAVWGKHSRKNGGWWKWILNL